MYCMREYLCITTQSNESILLIQVILIDKIALRKLEFNSVCKNWNLQTVLIYKKCEFFWCYFQ